MTYDCNFQCPYCFERTNEELKGRYLTKEQIDAAFEFAGNDIEHISLFGGEPLLHKNYSMVEYIVKKAPEKTYSVITNGYCLDEYIDLFKTVEVAYIMVTLDGNRDSHDKRRVLAGGEPTYDKIMSNIRMCLDNGIRIRIRMNIEKDTIETADELRRTLVEEFKDKSEYLDFEISPMMEIKTNERNSLFGKLLENDEKLNDENQRNKLLSRFSPIVNCIINGERLYPTYSFCGEEQNKFIMDPLGLIYPCLVAVGRPKYALGTYYPELNIYADGIRNRNIETIEKCKTCEYSLLCGGGCPLKVKGENVAYAPECESIISEIHDLLPVLLEAKNNAKARKDC
ncbi:MAG: radical SAM protein [Lachnospiraceae bacterium]|nr:radical SAM protein [Lachnospiraceae bacterium]